MLLGVFLSTDLHKSNIILKCLAKRFYIRRWKYLRHVPKVKGPPPPIIHYFFSFFPVKLQDSKYSSHLFDLSLFKDMYFKQILKY